MNRDQIEELVVRAVDNLFLNQPNIFAFTSQTGQTEWNLTHHLANEISAQLTSFDCDVDVMKTQHGYQRPDIIFHRRLCNECNLLVVEAKRQGSVDEDREKMRVEWFGGRLRYQFGALINLFPTRERCVIEVLDSGRRVVPEECFHRGK